MHPVIVPRLREARELLRRVAFFNDKLSRPPSKAQVLGLNVGSPSAVQALSRLLDTLEANGLVEYEQMTFRRDCIRTLTYTAVRITDHGRAEIESWED